MTRAPLRFLLCLLALWIGARAAILLPDSPDEARPVPAVVAAPHPAQAATSPDLAAAASPPGRQSRTDSWSAAAALCPIHRRALAT